MKLKSALALVALLASLENAVAQLIINSQFTGLNEWIPDGGELVDVRRLSVGVANISELRVSLEIDGVDRGGFNGDLFVTLGHDDGYAVLLNRLGKTSPSGLGYADSGLRVTLDAAAANGDIHVYRLLLAGSHSIPLDGPLTGRWQPDGRATDPAAVLDTDARPAQLSSFQGLDVSGEWRLFLADMAGGGQSQLRSWGLDITASPEPAATLAFGGGQRLRTGGDVRQFQNALSLDGNVTVDEPQELTLAGQISGSGGLIHDGAGRLILSAANDFSGGVQLDSGTLALGHDTAMGSGPLHLAGGAIESAGGLRTVANPVNISANTAFVGADALTFNGPATLAGDPTLTVNNVVRFTGGIGDSGGAHGLTKGGSGRLILDGVNSFAGPTIVNSGTLEAAGRLVNSAITINGGGTVTGSGATGPLVINSGGIISPGLSPGTIETGSETWNGGGVYLWEINRADGVRGADPGWDWMNISGDLTIDATAANRFTIELHSLELDNSAGPAANFDNMRSYSWTIATASAGISGFDAAAFNIDAAAFVNDLGGGSFNLIQVGNDLSLAFMPVPEPPAGMLAAGVALLGLALVRRLRLARWRRTCQSLPEDVGEQAARRGAGLLCVAALSLLASGRAAALTIEFVDNNEVVLSEFGSADPEYVQQIWRFEGGIWEQVAALAGAERQYVTDSDLLSNTQYTYESRLVKVADGSSTVTDQELVTTGDVRGTLPRDLTWQDNRQLAGDVIVPADITLTVTVDPAYPSLQPMISANGGSFPHAIVVHGTLNVDDGYLLDIKVDGYNPPDETNGVVSILNSTLRGVILEATGASRFEDNLGNIAALEQKPSRFEFAYPGLLFECARNTLTNSSLVISGAQQVAITDCNIKSVTASSREPGDHFFVLSNTLLDLTLSGFKQLTMNSNRIDRFEAASAAGAGTVEIENNEINGATQSKLTLAGNKDLVLATNQIGGLRIAWPDAANSHNVRSNTITRLEAYTVGPLTIENNHLDVIDVGSAEAPEAGPITGTVLIRSNAFKQALYVRNLSTGELRVQANTAIGPDGFLITLQALRPAVEGQANPPRQILDHTNLSGIRLEDAHDVVVEQNTINSSGEALRLTGTNNIIRNNQIKKASGAGSIGINLGPSLVAGELGARHNQVLDNRIEGFGFGLVLDVAQNNLVRDNTFKLNDVGIALGGTVYDPEGDFGPPAALNNRIYNNRFLKPENAGAQVVAREDCWQAYGENQFSVDKTPGPNIMGGPFLGGNSWNTYSGNDADGDGLGDQAMILATTRDGAQYTDPLPLFHPLIVNLASDEEDADPADGVCDVDLTTPGEQITLRAAIQVANLWPGRNTIYFNLEGTGTPTIQPARALPDILEGVVLDATTQGAGSPPTPGHGRVILDGVNAGDNVHGLLIDCDNSRVNGFVIHRFSGHGLFLFGGGQHRVSNNRIGADEAGSVAMPNGNSGIMIFSSSGNLIGGNTLQERNLISGNSGNGIEIAGPSATDNRVQGNFIGTDLDGQQKLGNGRDGVFIEGALDNLIGGAAEGTRNLLSGNKYNGVKIAGKDAQRNRVEGNYIGVNPSGNGRLGNEYNGVMIEDAANNVIGGETDAQRNIIGGNGTPEAVANNVTGAGNGVLLSRTDAQNNAVQGNYIGLNPDGSQAVGNYRSGVRIDSAGENRIVNNLISGNDRDGVEIVDSFMVWQAMNNQVLGNNIGLDRFGQSARANLGTGVRLERAPGNIIGGPGAGEGNLISGNGSHGILITDNRTRNNIVQGNYIGTDRDGVDACFNQGDGVHLAADGFLDPLSGNVIGGTQPGARNIISGNNGDGVKLLGAAVRENRVIGNYIGLKSDGTETLDNAPFLESDTVDNGQREIYYSVSNRGHGVALHNASSNLVSGNVISANQLRGISISGSLAEKNVLEGNRIGTDKNGDRTFDHTGLVSLANHEGGVVIEGAPNNLVGGRQADQGNLIAGNRLVGLKITGAQAKSNRVEGNRIGTDLSGIAALGNMGSGILLDGVVQNSIGAAHPSARNVISGNWTNGVEIVGPAASNNVVYGNFIGIQANGLVAMPNEKAGIYIERSPLNRIGGKDAHEPNVISGNRTQGLMIRGQEATDNVVAGNFIGTDTAGNPVANGSEGVFLQEAQCNLIGGTDPGAGNLIAGNQGDGVRISEALARDNRVLGNRIGVNRQNVLTPNDGNGVVLERGTSMNQVGDGTAEGANVIGGNNDHGVLIRGIGTSNSGIRGNSIGTDAYGRAALGNGGHGVGIEGGADSNFIGGTAPGAGNRIAFNALDGVYVAGGRHNPIQANSIYSNGSLGIDLGADGVTANDNLDVDPGPNNQQNFPILNAASHGSVRVQGTLNSAAQLTYRLEFFASNEKDHSGYGEGQQFLGARDVTTDANGDASFDVQFANFVAADHFITATATDPNGNTSEFSPAAKITRTSTAVAELAVSQGASPDPVLVGSNLTYQITFTNSGPDTATSATATNYLPATVTFVNAETQPPVEIVVTNDTVIFHLGDLASKTAVQATLVVKPTDAGPLTNRVTLAAHETDSDLDDNEAEIIAQSQFPPTGSTDLAVTASAAPDPAVAGANLTYTVTVTNLGPQRTTGAVVTNQLPAGAAFVSATVSQGAVYQAGDEVVAELGPLNDQAAVTLTIVLSPASVCQHTFTGSVTADDPDTVPANNQAVLVTSMVPPPGAEADLALLISDAPDPVAPGAEVTYTVTVTNLSTQFATEVVVTNNLPANAQFVSASSGQGTATRDGARVVFDLGCVGASQAVTMTIVVQPDAAGALTNVANVAAAQADPATTNNRATATTHAYTVNYVVTSSDDDGPGTLRQAITDANANPGRDVIGFAIPGEGVPVIMPGSPLPAVSDPVVIDGFTQPGQLVELSGWSAGDSRGLRITSGSCFIRGLVINNFNREGILISTAGSNIIQACRIGTDHTGLNAAGNGYEGIDLNTAGNVIGGTESGDGNLISGNNDDGIIISSVNGTDNQVLGNYIGTDVTGAKTLPNDGNGISITGPRNIIGGTTPGARNIIAGNTGDGLWLSGANARENKVLGNYIGLDVTGTKAIGNQDDGIDLDGAANNVVGGTDSGTGNIISGNAWYGIYFEDSSTAKAAGNNVWGNFVGTDAQGRAAVPNRTGIWLSQSSTNNIIGGGVAGARNVVSGNTFSGIYLSGSLVTGTVIEGNFIGTTADGAAALGNGGNGVILSRSPNNRIGGAAPESRNLISGNLDDGVEIAYAEATNNVVMGNWIGLDAAGTGAISNALHGIYLNAAVHCRIGGAQPGEGNRIAHNGKAGIGVSSGSSHILSANRIFANTELGIDLNTDGVTANDAGDADTGANQLQNFPRLTAVTSSGPDNWRIEGTLNSTPNTTYRIEFFANAQADPSGHGEGALFLGATDTATDANGDAAINHVVSAPSSAPFVTATATDPDDNTSEFSPALEKNDPPVALADSIERPANNTMKVTVADLLANDTDPEGGPVEFQAVAGTSANGATLTREGGWIFYTPPVGFNDPDTFTYTISDNLGSVAAGAVNVTVRGQGNEQTKTIVSINNVPDTSHKHIRFAGIPGRTYEIQATEKLDTPNWQTLATDVPDSTGLFEYIDTEAGNYETRFYRAIHP